MAENQSKREYSLPLLREAMETGNTGQNEMENGKAKDLIETRYMTLYSYGRGE